MYFGPLAWSGEVCPHAMRRRASTYGKSKHAACSEFLARPSSPALEPEGGASRPGDISPGDISDLQKCIARPSPPALEPEGGRGGGHLGCASGCSSPTSFGLHPFGHVSAGHLSYRGDDPLRGNVGQIKAALVTLHGMRRIMRQEETSAK